MNVPADLQDRLHHIFASFAAGNDVTPAALFRCEGYMQALIDTGAADWPTLRALVVSAATENLGAEAAALYADASEPQLHSHMSTAPVYTAAAAAKHAEQPTK